MEIDVNNVVHEWNAGQNNELKTRWLLKTYNIRG